MNAMEKKKLLIISDDDSGAGVMAGLFLKDFSRDLEVVTVGVVASSAYHALVLPLMRECMVDVSGMAPRLYDGNVGSFDIVVDMCERELLPSDITALAAFRFGNFPDEMMAGRAYRDAIKDAMFVFYRDVVR